MIIAGETPFSVQPSGDTTGVTDAARITAAVANVPAKGGTVNLAATGPWYIKCGNLAIDRSGVYLNAPGCFINAVGTGTVIRMFDDAGTFWPVYGGGILGWPVIDGASAGAGSTGLRLGDMLQPAADVYVQNFSGAGSIGVHFDNANFWTEQLHGLVYAQNCTQGVVFDVTGANTSTASFARTDLQIYINQVTASNDGVVLQNGASVYDGALAIRGNFVGSASALTSCVLRVTGTVPAGHPNAGGFANIADCRLDIGVECAANTHTPTTLLFGANSNVIKNCYGILDFGGDDDAANFTAAARIGNITPFSGIVNGDTVLTVGTQGFQSGVTWGATAGLALGNFTSASAPITGGTINPAGTAQSFIRVNPAGNITGVIIGAGSFDGQTIWIVNESAFTITFAAAGTSRVADGTSDVIAALTARMFVFDGADTNKWYRAG